MRPISHQPCLRHPCEWQLWQCCVDTRVILIWLRVTSPHPSAFIMPFLFLQRFSIISSCEKINLKSFYSFSNQTNHEEMNQDRFECLVRDGLEMMTASLLIWFSVSVEAAEDVIIMLHTKQSKESILDHVFQPLNHTSSLAQWAVDLL